jgi:small subunit ribosomal protein S16
VTIRLSRQGAKKDPKYLIVAMDKASKRDGAFLDKLGQYFPKVADPAKKLLINQEKVALWKSRGAQFSQTVGQLLKTTAK